MTSYSTGIAITVRYFGAARAAAGMESEAVTVPAGATMADLIDDLAHRDSRLATVLARCSYLRDETAVRDSATVLSPGETVDILPPFAGG